MLALNCRSTVETNEEVDGWYWRGHFSQWISAKTFKNYTIWFSINIGRTEKDQEYEHGTLIAKNKNDDVICYEILTTDNNSYLLNVFDDKRCINKLQHKNIYFDVESKIVHDDMIKLFYKFAREESLSYKFKSVKKINTIE